MATGRRPGTLLSNGTTSLSQTAASGSCRRRPRGAHLDRPAAGLVVEPPLPHWQRQVRRALEHRELSDVPVDLLDHLHPARPGADDADALALEVHGFLRPQAGMVADAAEVLQR